MAYRRRSTRGRSRRSYGGRRRSTRRTSMRRGTTQRVVIQVIGAPGSGQVPIGVTAGKKQKRTLRARY